MRARTRLAALAALAALLGPVPAASSTSADRVAAAGARDCDPHKCQAECRRSGLNGFCVLDTGDCMCLRPGR